MNSTITSAPATIAYDAAQSGPLYTVTFSDISFPATAADVVLMRPGAVSHHSCMAQRMIRLTRGGTPPPGQIQFYGPLSQHFAPKGYYMLFLVNSAGVPSVATWVYVG